MWCRPQVEYPSDLTFDKTWIIGSPTWTPDGREIVFSSARGRSRQLYGVFPLPEEHPAG